ncbi:MAG: SRPBCC family protein [Acidimicrobiales bacterium]|nr:SRPBCC family protein [Acidimicrobiales bacterium]
MARYRTSVTTTAHLDEVFAYLADFSNAEQWDPGVVEGRRQDDGPLAVGSTFRIVSAFAGRKVPLTYEIVELDAPHRVVLQAENAFVRSTDTMTFERDDAEGVTTVTYDADLVPKGVFKLSDPIFVLLFNRIGDKAAAGLQHAVFELSLPDADVHHLHGDDETTGEATEHANS